MKDGKLILRGVSKSINGVMILDKASPSFLPGRITGLIGPNGAGKTTLFHVITGEMRADNGKVLFNGEDLSGLPPYRVARKGVGRLFQDVRIFGDLTLLDNLAAACSSSNTDAPWHPFFKRGRIRLLDKKVLEEADYWLNAVGLWKWAEELASSLSYGQQKLLAIARLMAGDFSLMLLDEPTAGLNPGMIPKILEIFDNTVNKHPTKTIVLVEHNMSVISEIADWVYFMNEGRISFFGRTDHVLGDKEAREIYLGL